MSIFDNREKELIEQETEETLQRASDEYQRELDKAEERSKKITPQVLKKALELACDELDELADCCCDCHMDDFVYDNFYDNEKLHDSNYFIAKSEEILNQNKNEEGEK